MDNKIKKILVVLRPTYPKAANDASLNAARLESSSLKDGMPSFFDWKIPENKVMMALKMTLVPVSLTNIWFVLGVKAETVLRGLSELHTRRKKSTTCCSRVASHGGLTR